ncbi:glycoside hydrolase family 2 TIM barrel-domain containing protein [Neobacillus sp. SM06]|uniref:glycoside hydrolase family 2 TIM barrel-domain containing protein n=1 Tax=Neobacillus sp. SM06 TaxID=3422492 RepID=UPI003D267FC9
MTKNPDLSWLSDVKVFAVNRLPAHSDHTYYETLAEAKKAGSMAMRYELNGNWKFHYAVNPANRPEEFYQSDFDCSYWGNITVPGHIQLQGYGQPQYVNTQYPWDGHHEIRPPEIPLDDNPVGSYVKHFVLPEQMENQPVYISFQGVESAFYVWLNGEFVGYSEDSFTPAEFELTPFITKGENKLAVEVYQRSTGSWLEDQDFWRFSGIFRDVYLYTVPKAHIYDLHIRAELDSTFTKGTIQGDFQLLFAANTASKIVVELEDPTSDLIAVKQAERDSSGNWTLSMDVDQPKLWSAEKPYLYRLYIHVYDEHDQLAEVVPQKIGFRRFEMMDKIMHLNGKRIVFKGVNRHEFNCRKGRAITKEDMLWDIQTMKRHNINAVRTSHYPNQSYWYELCDEYGIYVIDEMNLETHGSWQKMGAIEPSWTIPGNKHEWQHIVMDRAISMFERDKNHPSILIWSCGNESYGGEVILNVSRYFKSVDPSRLVHYEGVFHTPEYKETSDMESRMYAKPHDIENYLADDPKKPYISCEYMHAMGNSLGGMYKYTDLEKKYPMYQGGFIWDFIDQAMIKKDRYGKEFLAYGGDFGDRPTDYGFCTNGIVYADRKLSPKMQEVKFLYQTIKLVPDKDGVTIVNENLFSNTAGCNFEYALFLEGKELYRHQLEIRVEPQSEHRLEFTWPVGVFNQPGEYCIQTAFKVKKRSSWAEAGHEVAFGQFVFAEGQKVELPSYSGKLRVVQGDVNIGVHGRDFSILFSKQVGSLVSVNYAGREMIALPPVPLFWRATTDNDRGFGQNFHSGLWYAASLARKCVGVEVNEGKNDLTVLFTYHFSIHREMEVKVSYTVYPDGSIQVRSGYHGAENLPQMPIFALSFKLSADYDQLEWYALGPEENYSDRACGARLGIFKNTVADQVAGYVMPQESGNHTGVRTVRITNQKGQGIKISSGEKPVECTISPYTAFELEHASHHFELPPIHYTVVTVAGRQMGVGGDDSWGAPVHDEHLLHADQNMEFAFRIQRV